MKTVDAEGLILGRMATHVAKLALAGEQINIINCEKAVVSGSQSKIDKRHKLREMGSPFKGPFYPKAADRIVKRAIRGMLPYKKPKGKDAFQRIMCHIGVPEKFNGKTETIEGANVKKLPNIKYFEVGKLCKEIGAKV